MIDVVLAIDDPLVSLGLEAGLTEIGIARSVTSAPEPAELDAILGPLAAPVLILDAVHRRADPELVGRLTGSHPDCLVLIYVRHPSDECVLRALLREGGRARLSPQAIRLLDECCLTALQGDARGCIPCDADADSVARAIEAVVAGEVAAAPWITAAARHQHGIGTDRPAITPRELEVMALVARGCSNKEIARRLSIKEQTVKNHLQSVMPKMGVGSRLELGLETARLNLRLGDGEDGS